MKIIDLLNKIANGEEVPKKIKYDGIEYEEEPCYMLYKVAGECSESQLKNLLNDQVEIIEEDKEENEIPNINLDNMKDIGTKVGKAYRELFEGLNKGWNTPLEEDKKIEKIKMNGDDIIDDDLDGRHFIGTNRKDRRIYIKKINELIDKVNKLEKEE